MSDFDVLALVSSALGIICMYVPVRFGRVFGRVFGEP